MTEHKDPTIDPSYRSAVLVAGRHGIQLIAEQHGLAWTVRAQYFAHRDTPLQEPVEATASRAAQAAWTALQGLVDRTNRKTLADARE